MAFKFDSPSEKKFYQNILTEAINKYGYSIEYWRADRDKTKDRLYSEDSFPNFVDKFPMKAWFQPIQEVYMFNKFGFQSADAMDLYISNQQFYDVMGPDTTPRAGDYIWLKYQNRVYIISTVEREDNIFLQEKSTYRMHIVAADVEGGTLTANTSGDEALAIENWPNIDPLEWDDNSANAEEISGVLVDKLTDVSPFGDWE